MSGRQVRFAFFDSGSSSETDPIENRYREVLARSRRFKIQLVTGNDDNPDARPSRPAPRERPGTIIVDTPKRFLYFVLPGKKAVRYGIGVGKAGFAWEGEAYIAWKQEWPKWTPPKEMIDRKPELARYGEDGMKPGLKNPLGARALYLFNERGEDTLFRLHGTPEWKSIGTAASSGCIRLMNQDIIDLYNRVRPGKNARVVVKQ
jgi:lipoprotein-anchoring transpeptidase ErfK/SrfK